MQPILPSAFPGLNFLLQLAGRLASYKHIVSVKPTSYILKKSLWQTFHWLNVKYASLHSLYILKELETEVTKSAKQRCLLAQGLLRLHIVEEHVHATGNQSNFSLRIRLEHGSSPSQCYDKRFTDKKWRKFYILGSIWAFIKSHE